MPSLQLAFREFEKEKLKDFGGSLVRGNPRERRPISLKRPLHLVMRSSLARGERSFLRGKHPVRIRRLIENAGRRHGVKVYRQANSGNHLHLIVLPRTRAAYHAFVRSVSGLIARAILRAERGASRGLKFWDARPFTRILEWGKDYARACAYLKRNTLEALGFIPSRPRAQSAHAPKAASPPRRDRA